MTPKEKARNMVSKYINLTKQTNGAIGTVYNSKQCAIIAVNEMIEEAYFTDGYYNRHKYWKEVKQEIEKL